MNVGDKVELKHDNYPTFEMERVNGQKIKRIIDVNNQPVADDMGIGKYYSKYKDSNSVLKVAILDNGSKVPVKQIKVIKENKMKNPKIKLVENFIRRQVRRILNERHVQIEYEDGFGDIHYLSTVVSDDVRKATETYKHTLKNDRRLLSQITKKVGEPVDMNRIVGTFVD